MADLSRVVAGISCFDVLGDLSNVVDGAVGAARLEQIRQHLSQCDTCDRFGTSFAGLLVQVRAAVGEPAPLDAAVSSRLRASIARARSA